MFLKKSNDEPIKLTYDYMKKKFDLYNKKYFEGKLFQPTFVINHSKRSLGCYVSNRNLSIHEFSVLKMSDYYKRTEKDFDNTLIHEMIHLYQHQNNCCDRGHGIVFKSQCARINKDGWNLSRLDSNSYEVSESVKKQANKTYYVGCYVKKGTTEGFIFVMSKPNVENFKRYFMKRTDVYEFETFVSHNSSVFDNFTKCRNTIRGKRIDKSELIKYRV